MDKYIRDDFDQIDVTYYKLKPTPFLPIPKKENCLKITGVSSTSLLEALNKRASHLQFKECSQGPLLITYENTDESAMGRNANAQKLKGMGSKAKGGNTLLGMLFLSSIQTESVMVKAKGQVVVKLNNEVSQLPFETEFYDSFYVKSDKNPEGKINIESEVISRTERYIWDRVNPTWDGTKIRLKFDVKNEYYEDFKWDLHNGKYTEALSKLDLLKLNYRKNGDVFFHSGILNEYFGEYNKALTDYQSALKLNFNEPTLASSIDRVQKEILYKVKIGLINPGLIKK